MICRLAFIVLLVLLLESPLFANPNQFGSSGLLNVPSADTLDSANFCFGLWGNCSSRTDSGTSTIMPVAMTLGVGTFWEVYGTYPNLLFNDDAQTSGRGTADIGMKLRFWGKRDSNLKLAADIFASRYVDNDPAYNGITDKVARIIASANTDFISAHLYGGYRSNGDSRDVVLNNTKSSTEYPAGGGLDIAPSTRSRITLELIANDLANAADAPMEASLGFQYYLTPHLTLNLAYGVGLNDAAPDWRALIGLTTCQGVGAYIKPIPEVTRKGAKVEVVKPTKVIPLSPLLIKTPLLTAPVSKFEVPVDPDGEEVLIRPYGKITIAPPPAKAKEEVAEYTLTRVSGTTPLYGVRIKGETPEPVPVPETPMTIYRRFRVPDNLFEFDNADIVPEVQKSVAELADFLRKDTKWVYIRIDGHTDAVGSVRYNLDLSLKRAISAASYLITREGIDPSRIFVRGMGKSEPIADNSTDEGRKLNRRFEVVFLVHKEDTK